MQRHTKHFGPYAVLAQVGSGGMGTIYRALDTRLEREVALKVLHRDLDVSGARQRFVNEARVVSSLNHPNICTIFDIGEQGEDLFLVMEMLHGQSLKERIAAGPLPAEEIRTVGRQVAKALEAAHARSIVHRDIKPANIFLLSDDMGCPQVKVLDFGLAKYNSTARTSRTRGITRHGATVGTVEYMSPEQACGYETDARSDLFSLGAVLYEMATGKAPFRGATSAVIYSELLNNEPMPARDACLDLPEDLDRVIQLLLRKSPDDRIQTASELIRELTQTCSAEKHACRHSCAPQAVLQKPAQGKQNTGTRQTSAGASQYLPVQKPARISRRRRCIRLGLLVVLLVLLGTTVKIAWAGRNRQEVFRGTLQVSPLFNGTGDTALDNVATELIEKELDASANFAVHSPSGPGWNGGRAAKVVSDIARDGLLTGSILPVKNGACIIHLEVADTRSHVKLAEADELAPSVEQVPAAVSRAASVLREALEMSHSGD